jgi:hypothetical protein
MTSGHHSQQDEPHEEHANQRRRLLKERDAGHEGPDRTDAGPSYGWAGFAVLCMAVSGAPLLMAQREIPMGTAYAVRPLLARP